MCLIFMSRKVIVLIADFFPIFGFFRQFSKIEPVYFYVDFWHESSMLQNETFSVMFQTLFLIS